MLKQTLIKSMSLAFFMASLAFAARELVGPYVGHAVNGNTALITCQGTHRVKLVFCREDIVRVEIRFADIELRGQALRRNDPPHPEHVFDETQRQTTIA